MIKIPATPEGIPAIDESIAGGLNINVTLIFSKEVYAQVIEAYLRGLEHRVAAGTADRVDRLRGQLLRQPHRHRADKQIEAKIAAGGRQSDRSSSLLGKVAIANAKLAYQLFKERFGGERFAKLRERRARAAAAVGVDGNEESEVQRRALHRELSSDRRPVNTIPPKTYDAFSDHGKIAMTLEQDVDDAKRVLADLEAAGISLRDATAQADGRRREVVLRFVCVAHADDRDAQKRSGGSFVTSTDERQHTPAESLASPTSPCSAGRSESRSSAGSS